VAIKNFVDCVAEPVSGTGVPVPVPYRILTLVRESQTRMVRFFLLKMHPFIFDICHSHLVYVDIVMKQTKLKVPVPVMIFFTTTALVFLIAATFKLLRLHDTDAH
jgi:hypothetical protein